MAKVKFTLANAVRVAGPDRILFWGELVVGSRLRVLSLFTAPESGPSDLEFFASFAIFAANSSAR